MTIKVMIVDDSAVIRGLITRALEAESDIEVVASIFNGSVALPRAQELQPDVIILDIEMPVMDGLTALPELIKLSPNSKIIMASTLTKRNADISLRALSMGATDYLPKPSSTEKESLPDFFRELLMKVRVLGSAAKADRLREQKSQSQSSPRAPQQVQEKKAVASPAPKAVAAALPKSITLLPETTTRVKALMLASSTGGPQALNEFFRQIKSQIAHIPIFVVQHMPPTFTMLLAEQIGRESGVPCAEGKHGEIVEKGRIYVAPGDYHMQIRKGANDAPTIHLTQDPPVNYCRPAADVTIDSLTDVYGPNLLATVFTGMGSDGFASCKSLVAKGGAVIAQNEATSVVWGMPKAVAEAGICQKVLPLNEIAPYLIGRCK